MKQGNLIDRSIRIFTTFWACGSLYTGYWQYLQLIIPNNGRALFHGAVTYVKQMTQNQKLPLCI